MTKGKSHNNDDNNNLAYFLTINVGAGDEGKVEEGDRDRKFWGKKKREKLPVVFLVKLLPVLEPSNRKTCLLNGEEIEGKKEMMTIIIIHIAQL